MDNQKKKHKEEKPVDVPPSDGEIVYTANCGGWPISLTVKRDPWSYKFGKAKDEAEKFLEQFKDHQISRTDAAIACGQIERMFTGLDMTVVNMCSVVRQ